MVLLRTSDWKKFEEYARNCKRGFYQISADADGVRVRVQVRQLCFEKVYDTTKTEQEKKCKRVTDFCDYQGYIPIEGSIAEEVFFS